MKLDMNTDALKATTNGFASSRLLIPTFLCIWLLTMLNFSPPDDWRVSRFGTAPILPPKVLTVMKLVSRGGAAGIMCFSVMSVWMSDRRRHVLALMAPLLAYGLYGMMSTSWSALKSVSLQQSVTFMMLLAMACHIGIVWRSDRDSERIVKQLALAIFALCILLLALRFGMPRSGSLTRESAGILHSTASCAAGGLGILLTLAARFLWRSTWSKWWIPIVAIELAMMLIAGNRLSVIVTFGASVLLLSIVMHRGYAALVLVLISLGGGGYFVLDPGLKLVETVGKEVGMFAKQGQSKSEIGSFSGRSEMWDKMWRSYQKAPILGHGFFVSTAKGRIYVWHEWGNWTAHNAVLQALVTTGAVGLTLLVLGFVSLGFGVQAARRSLVGVDKSLKLLGVASVWYCGWGVLNESFVGPLSPEVLVFAALIGIAAGLGSSAKLVANRGAQSESFEGMQHA